MLAELSLACGSVKDEFHTTLGDTIDGSKLLELGADRQPRANEEYIIGLSGNEQPEAARVIYGVIKQALLHAEILDGGNKVSRGQSPDGDGTSRIVRLTLTENNEEKFVTALNKVVDRIRKSPELKRQCHRGVVFSLNTVNHIKGAKPLVLLDVPRDDAKEPHFYLTIEGTPEPIARDVARIFGIDEYASSPERTSRDLQAVHRGGRRVIIPLNETDKTDQALIAYEDFVRVMRNLAKSTKGIDGAQPSSDGRV